MTESEPALLLGVHEGLGPVPFAHPGVAVCVVITETAGATANELLDSISALPDLAEVTGELATLAEFYLRFSDAVAGNDLDLAGYAHDNAVQVMTWLTAYDIDRVPRVILSRIRMLAIGICPPWKRLPSWQSRSAALIRRCCCASVVGSRSGS